MEKFNKYSRNLRTNICSLFSHKHSTSLWHTDTHTHTVGLSWFPVNAEGRSNTDHVTAFQENREGTGWCWRSIVTQADPRLCPPVDRGDPQDPFGLVLTQSRGCLRVHAWSQGYDANWVLVRVGHLAMMARLELRGMPYVNDGAFTQMWFWFCSEASEQFSQYSGEPPTFILVKTELKFLHPPLSMQSDSVHKTSTQRWKNDRSDRHVFQTEKGQPSTPPPGSGSRLSWNLPCVP